MTHRTPATPAARHVRRERVIDAIEAWGLGFHLGNVVKYVARAAHEDNQVADLRKARWYLDREIQRLERR